MFLSFFLTYSGILVDLFKVYYRRRLWSFGLQTNQMPHDSLDRKHLLKNKQKTNKKKKSTDKTDLNQGQEELGKVSRSVASYVFVQLVLEHCEWHQSKYKNKSGFMYIKNKSIITSAVALSQYVQGYKWNGYDRNMTQVCNSGENRQHNKNAFSAFHIYLKKQLTFLVDFLDFHQLIVAA